MDIANEFECPVHGMVIDPTGVKWCIDCDSAGFEQPFLK